MTVLLITVMLRGSSAAEVPSPPTKMPTYWPGVVAGDDVVLDHGVVDQPAVDRIEPDRGGAARAHAEPVAVDRPRAAGADLDEVVVVAAAVRERVIHVVGADHAAAEAVHGVAVVEVVERVVLDQDVGRERADAVGRRAVQERRVDDDDAGGGRRRCPSTRRRRPRRRRRCSAAERDARSRTATRISCARPPTGTTAEAADDDPLRAGDRHAGDASRPRRPRA